MFVELIHEFLPNSDKSTALQITDRTYELETLGDQTVDMELHFAPSEVASYDFDLPMFINSLVVPPCDEAETDNDIMMLDEISTVSSPLRRTRSSQQSVAAYTPAPSSSVGRKTAAAATASRRSTATVRQLTVKRRVTAVGLRHALHLSTTLIHFKIPIKYFENLKEGGFYEAKVICSFQPECITGVLNQLSITSRLC